jgi:hypothetical protein
MGKTGIDDPTYAPGSYVFGCSIPGMAAFGEKHKYPQYPVFGKRTFGGQVPGVDIDAMMFAFHEGAPDIRIPRRLSVSPFMNHRKRGKWTNRIIYQVVHGKQRRRRYTPYDGSPKVHLAQFCPKFSEAFTLWKTFPEETKAALDSRASKLGLKCTGRNYWTKLWIQDKPERLKYLP